MLKDKILADIKEAMKNKDNFKRDTLRLLHSAIKQYEIDNKATADDEIIIKTIQKAIKQREDSATQYKAGGRSDLSDQELKEASLLQTYLPPQLSDEELETKIKEIIQALNISSMQDIGQLMKEAKKTLSKSADGKRINEMAKKLLQ